MRIELRGFQDEAVDELTTLLDLARAGVARGRKHAVGLTAPTGAGKTVIATALIERLIFGTDDGTIAPDPGATFLWMTDLRDINAQTQRKMLATSSLLTLSRLPIVDDSFDAAELDAGKVYFLNTQKLGANGNLVKGASDLRQYPFWETVDRTAANPAKTLYLIIDEAHRGMTEGADRDEATSIMQRFIKGYPEGPMSAVPIVIGISATPARFRSVVEGSTRATDAHEVSPADVQASGLIKTFIATEGAGERQTDAIGLLHEAVKAWKDSTEWWTAYHAEYGAANDDALVVPALIVQVENEDDEHPVSKTDLVSAVAVINQLGGPLPDEAFVHAFGGGTDLPVGSRTIRYVEPARIADDLAAKVVFFKSSLGTGWDCPRAEVMFSFRRAVDPTNIAQTIGRMVRTPLAREIVEDERLNSVEVFLPHYDKPAVQRIVDYLRAVGDSATGDGIRPRGELVSLPRRDGLDAAFVLVEGLPTYTMPSSRSKADIRRLVDLARVLSKHGIDRPAFAREMAACADWLKTRRDALATDERFQAAVKDEGLITISRVEWKVFGTEAGDATTMTITASDAAIRSLFAGAARVLGGDVAAEYWRHRFAGDESAGDVAKLEAAALSRWPGVFDDLNAYASTRIDSLFAEHNAAIDAAGSAKRAVYDRIRGAGGRPQMKTIGHLPDVLEFVRGDTLWSKNLYADDTGEIRLAFRSSWERDTLSTELPRNEVIAWLRNEPRKEWSLCVPYQINTAWKASYPDFVIVRRLNDRLEVDILDPHDPSRGDAIPKAKGMSAYARDHGHTAGLRHIDLIAKVGDRLRRLHLEVEAIRRLVDALGDDTAELEALYRSRGD